MIKHFGIDLEFTDDFVETFRQGKDEPSGEATFYADYDEQGDACTKYRMYLQEPFFRPDWRDAIRDSDIVIRVHRGYGSSVVTVGGDAGAEYPICRLEAQDPKDQR